MIDNLVLKPSIPIIIMIGISFLMILIIILMKKNIINRILIVLLIIIISQRPMLETEKDIQKSVDTDNLDILFLVDRTISMNAIDVNGGTRLDAAKKDCYKIIDYFKNAYYTVWVYDKYPESKYPLTNETDIIKSIFLDMDVVNPNYVSNSPSLNVPFEELENFLNSKKRNSGVERIVFFISDGEIKSDNSNDHNFERYKSVASLIDNGAVLGYGTEKGERVKIKQELWTSNKTSDYLDKDGYLLGNNGLAIVGYNENNLKKLSTNIGLDYIHVTNSSVLEKKIEQIGKKYEKDVPIPIINIDLTNYFIGALLVLFFIELFYYRGIR